MAQASNLTPEQRTEIVLALLRREEPASILARRYGVSTKTISQWKDDWPLPSEPGRLSRGLQHNQAALGLEAGEWWRSGHSSRRLCWWGLHHDSEVAALGQGRQEKAARNDGC